MFRRAKRRDSENFPFFCFCVPHHCCLLWTHVRVFVHAFNCFFFFVSGPSRLKRDRTRFYFVLNHLRVSSHSPVFSTPMISTPTHPFRLHGPPPVFRLHTRFRPHFTYFKHTAPDFHSSPSVLIRYRLSLPAFDYHHTFFDPPHPKYVLTTSYPHQNTGIIPKALGNEREYLRKQWQLGYHSDHLIVWKMLARLRWWWERQVQLCLWSRNSWGFVLARFRGKRYPREWVNTFFLSVKSRNWSGCSSLVIASGSEEDIDDNPIEFLILPLDHHHKWVVTEETSNYVRVVHGSHFWAHFWLHFWIIFSFW